MYNTILLAVALQNWTEFSTHAKAAREAAISLAKGTDQRLHFLTVYDYDRIVTPAMLEEQKQLISKDDIEEYMAEEQQKMSRYLSPIEEAGIQVERIVKFGNPREEIAKTAREIGADLIVMGAHSKRDISNTPLGGTAESVTGKAPCQVLLVSAHRL